MNVFGLSEIGICQEAGSHVAWPISGDQELRGARSTAKSVRNLTGFRVLLIVYISKLELVQSFPDRPVARLGVEETKRVDFNVAILPGGGKLRR